MPLMLRKLKWKRHNRHFQIATHEDFLWVMTKAASGRPNRFNLVEVCVNGDLAVVRGRELAPGHCRKIAEERLNKLFPLSVALSESADIWQSLRNGSKKTLLAINGPIVDRVAKARPSLNPLIREFLLDFNEDEKTWDLTALGRRVRKHGQRAA